MTIPTEGLESDYNLQGEAKAIKEESSFLNSRKIIKSAVVGVS